MALYLLVTMVPFALLAPVVGPLLDRFRHGRRYALAATMLGRAFLAWLISDYIPASGSTRPRSGCWRCPARTAWPAAPPCPGCCRTGSGCPRPAPGRRVYGTVAGAMVAPIGLAAFWFGPQWPLRVAA